MKGEDKKKGVEGGEGWEEDEGGGDEMKGLWRERKKKYRGCGTEGEEDRIGRAMIIVPESRHR